MDTAELAGRLIGMTKAQIVAEAETMGLELSEEAEKDVLVAIVVNVTLDRASRATQPPTEVVTVVEGPADVYRECRDASGRMSLTQYRSWLAKKVAEAERREHGAA